MIWLYIYLIGCVVTYPIGLQVGVSALRGRGVPLRKIARSRTVAKMTVFWPLVALSAVCAFLADASFNVMRRVVN